jgi:hypothetical protein
MSNNSIIEEFVAQCSVAPKKLYIFGPWDLEPQSIVNLENGMESDNE